MTRTRWREKFFSVWESTAKRLDYFAADFVTTWTSRRANRNTQISGLRVVLHCQTLDTCQHRRGQSPTPAGMHGRKSAGHRVTKKDRNAVRSLDAGQNAFRVTYDHITVD